MLSCKKSLQVAEEIALGSAALKRPLAMVDLKTTKLEYPWTHQFRLDIECGESMRKTTEGFEEAVARRQLGTMLNILH